MKQLKSLYNQEHVVARMLVSVWCEQSLSDLQVWLRSSSAVFW